MGQDQSSYFLLPVAGGIMTLEPRANYTQLTTKPIRDDPQQQWAIEKNPANPNQLAFRHMATNRYMHATAPFKGQIALGAQQWWTPEPGDIPNAFWLKCEDYPNTYLANYYGGHDQNNTIWTWTKEMGYQYTMLWYFGDVAQWRAHRNSPPGLKTAAAAQAAASGGEGAAEAEKAKAEMESKEKELKEKEEKLQAQQNQLQQQAQQLQQQQNQLQQQSQTLSQQQEQLKQQQASIAEREQKVKSSEEAAAKARQDEEGKEAAMKEKQQQLEAREKAVAEKEAQNGKGSKDSPGQVADLQRQLDEAHRQAQDAKRSEQTLKAREAELEKREQEASRREQETVRREQQVQEAERNTAAGPSGTGGAAAYSQQSSQYSGGAGSGGGNAEDGMTWQRQRASQMSRPPPDLSRLPKRNDANAGGQSARDVELQRHRQAASRLNMPPFRFGQSSVDTDRGAAADKQKLERERARNADLEAQRQRMKEMQQGLASKPVPVPERMSDTRMQRNSKPIEMKRDFELLPRLPEKFAVA